MNHWRENPFEEKTFLDRLVEWITEKEFEAHGEVSRWDPADVAELIGGRDVLTGKIEARLKKDLLASDRYGARTGIRATLDFLFGTEKS